jgi:hypothetical protein
MILSTTMTAQARAALLVRACVCIRLKDMRAARAILGGGGMRKSDSARLNLLGIICELQKRWRRARRFYSRAIRADRAYEPPRENLRRLYELDTFGHSRVQLDLGDQDPQLWALRAAFLQRIESCNRRQLEADNYYHDNKQLASDRSLLRCSDCARETAGRVHGPRVRGAADGSGPDSWPN